MFKHQSHKILLFAKKYFKMQHAEFRGDFFGKKSTRAGGIEGIRFFL